MVLRDALELLDVLSRGLFFCNDSELTRLVFLNLKSALFPIIDGARICTCY